MLRAGYSMLPDGMNLKLVCRENLPFNSPVVTAGRPEEWLNDVEAAMFAATKKTLFDVLEASKATKKEKWVKDNQGQCIITAGQIVWTMECEKALSDPEQVCPSIHGRKHGWLEL
jgi:dynein heavy chain, axonemal